MKGFIKRANNRIFGKIKLNYHWWQLIHNADDIMLYYPDIKAKENHVNIHVHDVKKNRMEIL